MRPETGGDMDPLFDPHIPANIPAVSPSIPALLEGYPPYPRHIPAPGIDIPRPSSLWEGQGISVNPSTVTGASRKARIRVHPRCHQPILAGLDADVAALSVAVDPYPLTPAGEVWALQSGRRTYALSRGALERRDRWSIPGRPPSPKLPVLAEHACDSPVPPQHRAPPIPTPSRPATPEEIPW